jgi:NAD(P)-dependent dehydrogenase (short-subunit alcohol dehydrogenase family)
VPAEQGKVVVVTGAGAGVGRAIARRFGQDGCKVVLLSRGQDGLEGARRDVEAAGGTALAIPTDVADPEAVEAAAERAERELGPIDVWVGDAMTTVFAFFEDVEPEEFRRATDVTYHGMVWGTRAALKRMVPRDRGSIVVVGSALAFQGIPLQSPYCGAKHATKGFFDSVRAELAHKGSKVHISMVHLPGVNTPQFDHCRAKTERHPQPVAPVYQPEIAADAVHWAAHHHRRQVYVGVSTLYTVLGAKVVPRVAEWYLAKTAVKGQQTEAPPDAQNREGNLMEPQPGDRGARGRFGGKAHERSPQWWASKHRGLLAAAGAAALAGAAGLAARAER